MTVASKLTKGTCTRVMVLNCGSSSIKFQVVDKAANKAVLDGQADRLNTSEGRLKWLHRAKKHVVPLPRPSYPDVLESVCKVEKRLKLENELILFDEIIICLSIFD